MNPHLINNMSWAMSDVYASVTDALLENIARHFKFIKDGGQITGSWEYQVRKLAEIGQVRRESVAIIMAKLGETDQALQGMLIRAIEEGLKTADPVLKKAAEKGLLTMMPPTLSPNQMQAFRYYYNQSADKLNLVNTVMLESTEEAYRATVADIASRIDTTQKILNDASGKVITGVDSFNKVQHDAVRRMVDNGLTGFIDHGGHHWSPEAYVAMDTRTTMTNTARDAVWEQSEAAGVELYQVSRHDGARPLCYPWQGKVISRNGWTGTVEDDEGNKVQVHSEDEIESFRYGGGLFGVNCGHYPIPFIPGFSRIRPPQQTEAENAKEYAESQQQRALERNLREEKRELAVMKAQGATQEEIDAQKLRVRNASTNLEQFCDETGRARQRAREYTPVNPNLPGTNTPAPKTPKPTPTPATPSAPVAPVPAAPATPAPVVATPAPAVTPQTATAQSEYVTKTLPNTGIKEVPLTKWDHTPTEQEIIDSLGGADKTKGSCSSLAFAYAGNKGGYDVHDFRDGVSRYHFSACNNIDKIALLPGVDGVIIRNNSDFVTANEMLAKIEKGKEYYFGVAKHAAVVRATETGYEYLELQSATNNGWHTLTKERLKHRFGCQKSHSTYGMAYSVPGELMDVDKLKDNPEFIEILKYINTPVNDQRKGLGGGIK